MDRDRQQKIEEIFQELIDLPIEERDAALERRCGGDEDLEASVTELVEHYEAARPEFLQEPVFARGAGEDDLPLSVGSYKVVGRLGEGGMGVIYEAEQEHPKRRVAVKVLRTGLYSKSQMSRFRSEWDALGRLNHPGIAGVYEAGLGDVVFEQLTVELPYLAMELVDGRDLLDYAATAKLDRASRLELFVDVCDAVHYAHEQSVIHRDLKPSNIAVDTSGKAKVLDFGVARITDQERTRNTRTGDVIGTVRYMSPEQLFGDQTIDARTDVYSLGVILYELLTGESPYGKSDTSITDRILWHERGSVPRITKHDPTLRGDIDAIVRMAMATDPMERYQSVEALADDVRRYLQGAPVTAPGERRWDTWRRKAVSRRGTYAGIAAALIIAALMGVNFIKPFGADVTPGSGIAAGDRLAVMYFENLADPGDPQRRGEIVTELLIGGLSQSEQLNVVSSQRLHDLLEISGVSSEEQIDQTTATELARRASARWMMQGRILQSDPSFVIATEIVDVETGDVTNSLRTAGSIGESIFSVVDRITAETLNDVSVSDVNAISAVSGTSTRSEEAYRYYIEGMAYLRKQYTQEARDSFKEALAIDSTFAIAAFRLVTYAGFVPAADRKRYLDQARRHIESASWRDQQYIEQVGNGRKGMVISAKAILERYPNDTEALKELAWFAPDDERISYGKRLVEIDPRNEVGYNALSYAYSERGDLEKALWAVDKYAELAPNEPNVYDSRGEICARHGQLNEAIAAYSKAVEMKPDFADYSTVRMLGRLHVLKGEFDLGATQFSVLLGTRDPKARAKGREALIKLQAYRGHIDEALRQIDGAIAVDRLDGLGFFDHEAVKLTLAGILSYDIGEKEAALTKMTSVYSKGKWFNRGTLVRAAYLARVGASDPALQLLKQFDAEVDSIPSRSPPFYNHAWGQYELSLGNFDEAAHFLEEAHARAAMVRFGLVRAYIGAARWDDAIEYLEAIGADYSWDRFQEPLEAARLHYYLGVAYHEVGRTDEAIEQLERFLSIWKDADPRLQGPEDARRRLALLKRTD